MPELVRATIDINLPEFEYLADHLSTHECRLLVTALHDKNYDLITNLANAERKVPRDETCLKLLLHWNSTPGEGRGQDHEMICHRLHEIGRQDLAEWLSETVFQQLGEDLDDKILSNPFRETAKKNNTLYKMVLTSMTMEPPEEPEEPDQWLPIDSILCAIVIMIIVLIIFLLIRILTNYYGRKKVKRMTKVKSKLKQRRKKFSNDEDSKTYEHQFNQIALTPLENTNSEDVSDDDPTLSLLGICKPSQV